MPDQDSANGLSVPLSGGLASSEQKIIEELIGLGRMGIAMASNLAQNSCKVISLVRHPGRLKQLSDVGLDATIQMEALFDCPIVISMQPDDSALHAVVFGDHARG